MRSFPKRGFLGRVYRSRKTGRGTGGRPPLKPSASKVAMAKKLYADQATSIEDICNTLRISRATLYRYLKG
jgi:DNA invertase Pin-like site-specific DNA recombinase